MTAKKEFENLTHWTILYLADFSIEDLSLYADEIASDEAEPDYDIEWNDEPIAFDLLYHDVPISREEYKEVYGDDYTDEDNINE